MNCRDRTAGLVENLNPPSSMGSADSAAADGLFGGLRAELGSFKNCKVIAPEQSLSLSSTSSSSTSSSSASGDDAKVQPLAEVDCGCPCGDCAADDPTVVACNPRPSCTSQDSTMTVTTTSDESLRSIGGITDELIKTKLELARVKAESERRLLAAQQVEEVLRRRVGTINRAKEKFRKIARRLSDVPEVGVKQPLPSSSSPLAADGSVGRQRSRSSDPPALAAAASNEPFNFIDALAEEQCDYDPSKGGLKKSSSRTIDPDEMLWSRESLEFEASTSLRRMSLHVVDGRSLTRGISSKRLRDHLGPDVAVPQAVAAAGVGEAIQRTNSSHRRRGSTFW